MMHKQPSKKISPATSPESHPQARAVMDAWKNLPAELRLVLTEGVTDLEIQHNAERVAEELRALAQDEPSMAGMAAGLSNILYKRAGQYAAESRDLLKFTPSDALRELIKRRGMSANDLARASRIDATQISRMVRGKSPISARAADQLSRALGVDLRVLNRSEEPQHPLNFVNVMQRRLRTLDISQVEASELLLGKHRSYLSVLADTVRQGASPKISTALQILRVLGLMLTTNDGHAVRTPIELATRLRELTRQHQHRTTEIARRADLDHRTVKNMISSPDGARLEHVIAVFTALGLRCDIIDDPAWPGLPGDLLQRHN